MKKITLILSTIVLLLCFAFSVSAAGENAQKAVPIKLNETLVAKVFYEYRGFYGDDLKVARLEQFIEKSGKTDEFKARFEDIHGDRWEESRDAFAFFEDDITQTLMEVLGMSETAASNWFNGTETADISIEQLVKEIKEYIDSKGKNFRLLFMIDEVGQYIGSDGSLMLNLQTIVEEIGSKCDGRVWVMVTSQEAIDSITKISGDDFSKIQGRFNTRLSLSSSSVDEVIKKRIRDNWLLDIELYSEEFRADLLSIRMQELGMPATPQLRKAMKSYSKFFENKERVAKLKALGGDYTTPGQLHMDILYSLKSDSRLHRA